MKKLMFSFVILTLLGLTACDPRDNGGNDNVDGHGNCTQSYIDAYNEMSLQLAKVTRIQLALKGLDDENLKSFHVYIEKAQESMAGKCEAFYERHADISCQLLMKDEPTWVTSDDFKKPCQKANAFINANDDRAESANVSL
jgi:hypothetical protein